MIVLDTNVLSELMRDRPDPAVVEWVDAREQAELAITSITVAEVHYGIARLDHGARKSRLAAAFGELLGSDFAGRVLPFGREAAEAYGALVAHRDSLGAPIAMADAQIGAICASRGARLATRDVRGFADLGFEVQNPWDPE